MAQGSRIKIVFLFVAHAVFATASVFLLFLLDSNAFYIDLMASFPPVVLVFRWLILFLLGLPFIVLYYKYQRQKRSSKDEGIQHHLEIISVLNELLLERSPSVEYHSKRVASLTRSLCEELKLDEEQTKRIVFAAMFHNIGKLFLDSKLLNPWESLTNKERKQCNTHTLVGARILGKVDAYPGAGDIVMHYHESWDGNGFPEGLVGDDIPIGSRIIGVVDLYDALIHGLDDTPSLPSEQAMERLRALKGIRFDPYIVDMFDKMVTLKQGMPPKIL